MEVGMIEVAPSHAVPETVAPAEHRLEKERAEILSASDRSRVTVAEPVEEKAAAEVSSPAVAQIPGRAGSSARSLSPARQAYWDLIRRRIEKAMYYPRRARLARLEGNVRVGFTIEADGDVSRFQIIEASSHPVFNRTAIEIIKRAAPFPRPPAEIGPGALSVPINFRSTL